MCDYTCVTQSKLASSSGPDSPRNGSRNNSDTDHEPRTTPTKPRSQSERSTPTPSPRPTTSSAHNERLANSTPRLRSRPAPARALSATTPLLGRSLSMRVSKKERRWVTRLADPHAPRISTYQDDYQTPEALSLQSLNLETPTEREEGQQPAPNNAPTTYRQSYRWQGHHRAPSTPSTPKSGPEKTLLKSVSEDTDTTTKNSDSSFPEDSANSGTRSGGSRASFRNGQSMEFQRRCPEEYADSSSSRTRSGGSRASFRNGQSWEFQRRCPEDSPASPGTIHSPPSSYSSSRSSAFFRRNSSSGVISGQGSFSPTDRKSSSSSCEDTNFPVTTAQQKGVAILRTSTNGNASLGESQHAQSQKSASVSLKPANGKALNGERVQNPTAQCRKLNKVDREGSARDSQHQTPRQVRASHLQGSTGGSPFVYGSGTGTWV